MMPRKSFVSRLLLVTILAGMLFALPVSASSDAPTKVEFQAVADNGTLATCTLSLGNPYKYGSYMYAGASVSCNSTVAYIRLVVELAKRTGGSGSGTVCNRYDQTHYNVSYHYGVVSCYYYSNYEWQSRASGYAPDWESYRQSSWFLFK